MRRRSFTSTLLLPRFKTGLLIAHGEDQTGYRNPVVVGLELREELKSGRWRTQAELASSLGVCMTLLKTLLALTRLDGSDSGRVVCFPRRPTPQRKALKPSQNEETGSTSTEYAVGRSATVDRRSGDRYFTKLCRRSDSLARSGGDIQESDPEDGEGYWLPQAGTPEGPTDGCQAFLRQGVRFPPTYSAQEPYIEHRRRNHSDHTAHCAHLDVI
jgi:hypothetical protein